MLEVNGLFILHFYLQKDAVILVGLQLHLSWCHIPVMSEG
jgi:hypothetical protein